MIYRKLMRECEEVMRVSILRAFLDAMLLIPFCGCWTALTSMNDVRMVSCLYFHISEYVSMAQRGIFAVSIQC